MHVVIFLPQKFIPKSDAIFFIDLVLYRLLSQMITSFRGSFESICVTHSYDWLTPVSIAIPEMETFVNLILLITKLKQCDFPEYR